MALPADLKVRDLSPNDARAVIALVCRGEATYRQFAPHGWDPPEQDHAHWDRTLRDAARCTRGAFDPEGHLIAFLAWEPVKDPNGDAQAPAIAQIASLFVDPSRWRLGIATTLLAKAEHTMRECGYDLARLWTPEGAPAQRLYERNGWRLDGRRAYDRLRLWVVGYEKPLAVAAGLSRTT